MKENKKELKTKERGITLIALVITIIVLLILAGVSIAMLTGQNGILTQAQNAKKETDAAQSKEETTLGQYESYINRVTGNNAEVGKIVTGGNKPYTNNGTAIIPEGFMVVPGCDNVSQGLVISDNSSDTEVDDTNIVAEGNQFVWIPLTGSYQRDRTYADKNVSENAYTDTGYLPSEIQPSIDDSESNEQAERIAVENAGGFYISRYEAGKETNGYTNILVSKKGIPVWNNISQADCKTTAKTFINNENVKSALCSGIQWDKAMEFIEENDEDYNVTISDSNKHATSLAVSGANSLDKACNIYDLEGNYREYIAEKNSYYNDRIFIYRGGGFNYNAPSSYRDPTTGVDDQNLTFRFVLYVM